MQRLFLTHQRNRNFKAKEYCKNVFRYINGTSCSKQICSVPSVERVVKIRVLLSFQWNVLFKTKRVMQRLFLSHQRNPEFKANKEYCKNFFRYINGTRCSKQICSVPSVERVVKTTVLSLIKGERCSKQKSDAKTISVSSKKPRFLSKRVLQKVFQIYQWNALFKTDLLCPIS
jgi:hypothetical protein